MSQFEKCSIVGVSQQDLDELTCGICQDIFSDPVVLNCCRQTYCKKCIEEWLRNQNTCPNDRRQLFSSALSAAPRVVFNLLDNLKVKCIYQKYGCNEELTKREFDRHLKYCLFNTCETCNTRINMRTGHNCVHELKVKIDKLIDENQRTDSQLKTLIERNKELFEENSKLKTKHDLKSSELTKKVKSLEEKNRYLSQTDIGHKKEIEILKNKENDNKSIVSLNSKLNSELSLTQNEVSLLKSKLDHLENKNIELQIELNIMAIDNQKLRSDDQKRVNLVHAPFKYTFIFICVLFKFISELVKLLFNEMIALKNYLFRRPEVLWCYSRDGRRRRMIGYTDPGLWWRLFSTKTIELQVIGIDSEGVQCLPNTSFRSWVSHKVQPNPFRQRKYRPQF